MDSEPLPQWGCHADCHVGSKGRAVSKPFCPEEHTCWSVVMQTSNLSQVPSLPPERAKLEGSRLLTGGRDSRPQVGEPGWLLGAAELGSGFTAGSWHTWYA